MSFTALPVLVWLALVQAQPPPLVAEPAPVRAPNLADAVIAPDGPPSAADLSYENRILANFHGAQGRFGPYDGAWTVSGPDGVLYALQLHDPGAGESRIEGAWRDLRGGRSGLIGQAGRDGAALVLRIAGDDPHQQVELRLHQAAGRDWTGEVLIAGAEAQAIVMRRPPGLEVAAMEAPYVAPPPRPPPAKAKPRPAPKRAKAKRRR